MSNTITVLNLAVLVLNGIKGYFEGQDADNFGGDDRAARIIGYAIAELQVYIQELQAKA